MMLSQRIAEMLEEMLEEAGGELSIVRNEMASRLGCVPSQINYVITSRFTPERGYVVESRRGGGGYVRIRKVLMHRNEFLMHFYQSIGDQVNLETAAFYLSALQENMVKVQLVTEQPLPEELEIVHQSQVGRVQTIIVRGSGDQVADILHKCHPLLCDILPLSLEEVFIYELGGVDYEVKDILL